MTRVTRITISRMRMLMTRVRTLAWTMVEIFKAGIRRKTMPRCPDSKVTEKNARRTVLGRCLVAREARMRRLAKRAKKNLPHF